MILGPFRSRGPLCARPLASATIVLGGSAIPAVVVYVWAGIVGTVVVGATLFALLTVLLAGYDDHHQPEGVWHRYFAWYPVHLDGGYWAWLCFVRRFKAYGGGPGTYWRLFRYRKGETG